MYSPEEKRRAVELYIKYDKSCMSVIHELGYPSRGSLYQWYAEFEEKGDLAFRQKRETYSPEQKQAAVDHYLEHGRCMARTMRALGYPAGTSILRKWLDELAPDGATPKRGVKSFTYEQKKDVVVELMSRKTSAQEVADRHGVSRYAVYNWKRELLGKGPTKMKHNSDDTDLGALESKRASLEEEIRKLELERDILQGTVEIIKKDPSADPKMMTNREKTILIGALRGKHKLKDLLFALDMPRSSYHYQVGAMNAPDKHADLRIRIAEIFETSHRRYGYRRIWALLKSEGTKVSEKVVSRIMREDGHVAKRGKKRKYSSYVGEVDDAPANVVNRDFSASAPNELWLTDVTEFRIPAGKVYLSPVIDCFDGMVVAWTTSTSPTAEMANSMLKTAISTLDEGDHPVIHSDRGGHYRWPEWVSICEDAGLTRSMSRKGCSPDNSACEGFFGRMKVEMFYGESFAGYSISKFMETIDGYIDWYNRERIKASLGGLSPLEFRESKGFGVVKVFWTVI